MNGHKMYVYARYGYVWDGVIWAYMRWAQNFHKICVYIHVWQCKLGIYQMAGGEDGRG